MANSAKPVPPTTRGLYWAKINGCGWWDGMVYIKGESPYLTIVYAYSRREDKLVSVGIDDIEEWGPEIKTPDRETVL